MTCTDLITSSGVRPSCTAHSSADRPPELSGIRCLLPPKAPMTRRIELPPPRAVRRLTRLMAGSLAGFLSSPLAPVAASMAAAPRVVSTPGPRAERGPPSAPGMACSWWSSTTASATSSSASRLRCTGTARLARMASAVRGAQRTGQLQSRARAGYALATGVGASERRCRLRLRARRVRRVPRVSCVTWDNVVALLTQLWLRLRSPSALLRAEWPNWCKTTSPNACFKGLWISATPQHPARRHPATSSAVLPAGVPTAATRTLLRRRFRVRRTPQP